MIADMVVLSVGGDRLHAGSVWSVAQLDYCRHELLCACTRSLAFYFQLSLRTPLSCPLCMSLI
jgi:hypothetical protein